MAAGSENGRTKGCEKLESWIGRKEDLTALLCSTAQRFLDSWGRPSLATARYCCSEICTRWHSPALVSTTTENKLDLLHTEYSLFIHRYTDHYFHVPVCPFFKGGIPSTTVTLIRAELLQQDSVLCVRKLNSDMCCWSQHPSDTNLDTVFKICSCDDLVTAGTICRYLAPLTAENVRL